MAGTSENIISRVLILTSTDQFFFFMIDNTEHLKKIINRSINQLL